MPNSTILALPLPDVSIGTNGVQVVKSLSILEELRRTVEPAGHFYEPYYIRHHLKVQGTHHDDHHHKDNEEEKKEEFSAEQVGEWEKKRKKKKTDAEILQSKLGSVNHYEILELKELGMDATEKDIKTAYRKMALVYHPDKKENKEKTDGGNDPVWLKIQDAYETLIDPERRKKYDSTLDFDDSLPQEPVDPAEFYETFGRVFKRNAIWSTKKPVPDIGDAKTPLKIVLKFYEFWEKFQSWRDFTVEDEYKLEEAENRYERRYMEKENKRLKADLLKKEWQRIWNLIEMARNNDPRILQARKEEDEKREQLKQEKNRKKEQAKAEKYNAERMREEKALQEERDKIEKEKNEVERKKAEKDTLKNLRISFRKLILDKVNSSKYDKFFVQGLLEDLMLNDIKKIVERLEEVDKKDALAAFDAIMDERNSKKKGKSTESTTSAPVPTFTSPMHRTPEWTIDELSMLSKGLVKFPPGTRNRWGCISNYMCTRTQDEVIVKAKELGQNQSLRTTASTVSSSEKAFEQLKNQKDTMKPITEPMDKRVRDADPVETPKANGAEVTKVNGEETQKSNAEARKKSEETPKEEKKETEEDAWSQKQQQLLEVALREYPASLGPEERWNKIAERVEGKTRKQCVDRFKQLRAAVAKSKN